MTVRAIVFKVPHCSAGIAGHRPPRFPDELLVTVPRSGKLPAVWHPAAVSGMQVRTVLANVSISAKIARLRLPTIKISRDIRSKHLALLMSDTGLRNGEALALRWADVHLQPASTANLGYIRVQRGKSRTSRRTVSLPARVREMLDARSKNASSEFVFPARTRQPILATSLDHQHARVREQLNMPADFVVHSLRHTMLSRLGMLGVDAFTIMKIVGHSSITISQRYVHPSPESVELAFAKLEVSNQVPQNGAASIANGIARKEVELGIAGKSPNRKNRRKAM
jgi:integrase